MPDAAADVRFQLPAGDPMNYCLRGLLGTALSLGLCFFAPNAGANFLAGHTFTSTQGGTTQTYTFNKDLPGGSMGGYGGMPSPTAFSYVLIATQGFAALGLVTPDYIKI